MPLVAAATISVEASAYFYTANLIAGFLAYGAIALTYALYAVGVRDEAHLAQVLRFTLRLAFAVIIVANLALVVGARVILRAFGPEYAAHATTTLRLLGVSACLMIIKDHYVAIARIRGTILRASKLCATGAALEIGFAIVGGTSGNLTWIAGGGLIALALEVTAMSPTVIRELRRTASEHGQLPPRPDVPLRKLSP
jgi:Na+-driven multidrug efflux pump